MEHSSSENVDHEVALCRLCVGHTKLPRGHVMVNEGPPECDTCPTLMSARHILIDCQRYRSLRFKFLGLSPKLKVILGYDTIRVLKRPIFQNYFNLLFIHML